jgi:4-amino-4-deoxy-L-arabinose transferase-like glycosyltransferase
VCTETAWAMMGRMDSRPPDHARRALPPSAKGDVLAIAAVTVGMLLVFAGRDGYHRDELYFLEATHHLAFGYVDQPPLSVAMILLSRLVFGNSPFAIRIIPALAEGALVVTAGAMGRQLGGGRFAQVFAALCTAAGGYAVAAHISGPTIYDALAWVVASYLIIRIIRTGQERLWLAVGVVIGLGLEAKHTILFLVAGLAIGLVLNRQARLLRSPWLWAGVAVAVALWLPNLLWEAAERWPTLEMDRNLRAEHSGLGFVFTFPVVQVLLPNPFLAPVWIAGLWGLWREQRFRDYRAFAIAYAVLFVLLLVIIPDRPYYLAPLYLVLTAAGAVIVAGVVEGRRRLFSARAPGRRLLLRSRGAAVVWTLLALLFLLPIALPVLTPATLAKVPLQNVNYNLGETVGWPEFVAAVADVYRSIPPADRPAEVIFTSNYGEAGAIERYGRSFGLPGAFSGHNSFWWWGPPRPPGGRSVTVVVGDYPLAYLLRFFGSVRLAAIFRNPWGLEDDEEGQLIWICSGQREPWSSLWPSLRHYG